MKRAPAAAAKSDGRARQHPDPQECPEWEQVAAALKRPEPRKVIANKFRTFLFRPQAETETARIPEIREQPENCDWQKLWLGIMRAFRHEADCLIKRGNPEPLDFAPQTALEWLNVALDKFSRSWLRKETRRCYFCLHQDIGTWAYVFAMRELSLRHPRVDDECIERMWLSVSACRFLVLRFLAFARARRKFHTLVLNRFCELHRCGPSVTWQQLKELSSGKTARGTSGRPRKVKWADDQRDLWLVSIEPIAWLNRWTYADLLHAERTFFEGDLSDDDTNPLTISAIRSSTPDAKVMQARCKRLGIRLRGKKRPTDSSEPPQLVTVFQIPKLESPQVGPTLLRGAPQGKFPTESHKQRAGW